MRAIGAISGTSMDGIDVALVETDGRSTVRASAGATYRYPDGLRAGLLRLAAEADRAAPERLAAFDAPVTEAHVGAIRRFMAEQGLSAPDIALIGLHGQTILHRPQDRRTVQLGDGALAARMLGVATIDGFRLADVAAGGQGAPFAPLYHRALLGAEPGPVMVLNLGGVGNVTYLDGETAIAFDTGPASALLDDFMSRRRGAAFDRDGALAASGHARADMVAAFMADSFFARSPPKSLDRQHFHRLAASADDLSDEDGAATLAAFTVASVVAALDHVPAAPRRWLVTGGGRLNAHLMDQMRGALGVPVEPVESVGWDGDFLEAQAFAYLAVRSTLGLPLSLPSTTGVPRPMPGGRLHRA